METGPFSVLLNTKPTKVYTLDNRNTDALYTVGSMIFCNTSVTNKKLYFCITSDSDIPTAGAIFFGLVMEPGESITLSDRRIRYQQHLIAYSDADNAIVFSFDIIK